MKTGKEVAEEIRRRLKKEAEEKKAAQPAAEQKPAQAAAEAKPAVAEQAKPAAAAKPAKPETIPAVPSKKKPEAKPSEKKQKKPEAEKKAEKPKPEEKYEEKIVSISLRDAWAAPRARRAEKAARVLRQKAFKIAKKPVKLDLALNRALWARGITRPPRTVKLKLLIGKETARLAPAS